ncbi:MAG: hypothetical protein R2749_32100 [Acidimicrobiales bacterium]
MGQPEQHGRQQRHRRLRHAALRPQRTRSTSGSTFALTAAGRKRLRQLLAEPIEESPPRNALLLRLFFGRHLGVGACAALLQDAVADAEARLERYRSIADALEHGPASPDLPYWRIALAAGVHSATAQLAWAHESLEALPPDGAT